MIVHKLTLVANIRHCVVSDTSTDEPYSGYVESAIDLDIRGLRYDGPVEVKEKFFSIDDDTVYADFEPHTGVYLVVARYHDGGTFSGTFGYHMLCGVFRTQNEAFKRREDIENNKWPDVSAGGYTPWRGYFSGLDGVEVEFVPVLRP